MLFRFLAVSRFLLVVPVIGCVFLTLAVVLMGFGRIVTAGTKVLQAGDFSIKAAKTMSLAVIEIIDLFHVGTVSYIAAIGLYRLFISRKTIELPMRLKIDTLKDLEDKIIGVIVAALAVAFLGKATGEDADALLSYGGGIALVVVSLAMFMRYGGKSEEKKEADDTA